EAYREILRAVLSERGCDSFLVTETGIEAYLTEDLFDRTAFDEAIAQYRIRGENSVEEGRRAKVNRSEEWAKNYDHLEAGDKVHVRASFDAPTEGVAHEIIINPKMSFGTGHHATTYLMLTHQLTLDHQGKRVIDIGAGTGILAIMAHKLGAGEVQALDIDEWCVENGEENFALNGLHGLKMGLGTIREVAPQGPFDIV